MPKSRPPLLSALALLLLSLPGAAQERSLAGRKLPPLVYLDTEGHEIRAADYEGSVLVMFGGIPW
jgi:hypothetical protein